MAGISDPNQNPNNPQPQNPKGTGDNGETWDPDSKTWKPRGWSPSQSLATGPTNPNPGGGGSGNNPWSNLSDPTNKNGPTGTSDGQDVTPGRTSSDEWGGYSGTMVVGSDGKLHYDPTKSGRADDVNRLRGLGDKAGNASAYELQYGNANADASMGLEDRGRQYDASSKAYDAAIGRNSVAQALGRNTLEQGAQTQQAGALSTRGGPLASMSAVNTNANTVGGYRQRGNQALKANLADEMAAGRSQFSGMADSLRAGDAAAQRQNQDQTLKQGELANQQAELNQSTQMGYEGMAQGVNKAAQGQALSMGEQQQGIDAAAAARASRNSATDQSFQLGIADTAIQGVNSIGTPGGGAKPPPPDTSDRRAKRMADFYGGR